MISLDEGGPVERSMAFLIEGFRGAYAMDKEIQTAVRAKLSQLVGDLILSYQEEVKVLREGQGARVYFAYMPSKDEGWTYSYFVLE